MEYIFLLFFVLNYYSPAQGADDNGRFSVFTTDINLNPCPRGGLCNDTISCNNLMCDLSSINDDCSKIVIFVPDFDFPMRGCHLLDPINILPQYYGMSFLIYKNKIIDETSFYACNQTTYCVNRGCLHYNLDRSIMWLGFMGMCLY